MDKGDLLKEIFTKINDLQKKFEGLQSTWLDIKQTVNYLYISESKLRKMISAGEIPFKRVGKNGKIILNRRQIDLWLIYGKQKGFTKIERQRAEAFI